MVLLGESIRVPRGVNSSGFLTTILNADELSQFTIGEVIEITVCGQVYSIAGGFSLSTWIWIRV